MEMMKDLYQSGDENMKRTIAEAYTKSREKEDKNMSPLWTINFYWFH